MEKASGLVIRTYLYMFFSVVGLQPIDPNH